MTFTTKENGYIQSREVFIWIILGTLKNKAIKAPYIIIGMHRSGTSFITEVLEKAGIFMGVKKDHNYEAIHFLSLNQQTLWAADASWISPIIPQKKHYKYISKKALYYEHFKALKKIQKLKLYIQNPKWGWKDPRNTFTLNMWLELFPNAKVIHVYRNKEDVAQSLLRRNTVEGEVFDERLSDINFNLKLAKKYVKQARSYKTKLGKNYIEVNYDNIIALNTQEIKRLETFTSCSLLNLFKENIR